MNKKLFVFILVVFSVFTNVSAQTNDGYGMALEVFSANRTTVPHYETFTINYGLRNTSSDQFPINSQFGAALINKNGSIAGIAGTRDYGWALVPRQRTGTLEMTCTVPNTVTPGQYQLRMVVRPADGEWRIVTTSNEGAANSISLQVLVNNNVVVAPLLQTQWSQGEPYNDSFPLKSDNSYAYNDIGKLYVDCGTTAMAQIFAYHKHPVRAAGTSTVLGPHGINMPLVNFTNYFFDWANMRNTYTKGEPGTAKEQKAVAELNFIIGMARSSGTGSGTIFVENFGYDKSFQFHHRRDFTDAAWEAMIKEQLDQGLPVYYWGRRDGGSHAFVVDGYDKNGRFHINMGWGGTDDGWYTLNNINPPSSGHYNTDHLIYINVMPDRGSTGTNEFALAEFTSSSTSVSRSVQFSSTINLRSCGFFPSGQTGIALVGNNNNIVAVIGNKNLTNWQPGSRTSLTINCTVPGTVNAGQYRLMAVTRIEGGEWKLVTVSDREARVPNAINITVTGGGSAASQPAAQQPAAQQPAAQTLTANAPATVNINNGQRVRLSFTAPSAGEYRFESSNNGSLDPVAFSAASGTTSAATINDDGGSGKNFFFMQNLRAGEVFTFFAGVRNNTGNGSYTVNIQGVQSVSLALNAPAAVNISNGQRVQLSFSAPSAGIFTFESSYNGSLDPVAYSAVSGSKVISDDGGQGDNFLFTRNLRAGEVFTFYAGFLWDRGNGSYTVNVQGGR